MLEQLTKEELLKRVMALEDGTVIDNELQQILMSPDNSDSLIATIKRMSRLVIAEGNTLTGHMTLQADMPDKTRNDLVKNYIDTHKHVTDICKSGIGINPFDLEHPVMVSGADWKITIAKHNAFKKECCSFMVCSENEKDIFADIDKWITDHNYIHTYLYTIDNINTASFGSRIVERKSLVRLCGVTQYEIEYMKKHNPTDDLTAADYLVAAGYDISF